QQVGKSISQAVRLGGGEHRGNADVLPSSAGASQAFEVDQYAGAHKPGTQASHAGGTDISQCGQLSEADSGVGGGDTRGLGGGDPVLEHGGAQRTVERAASGTGVGGVAGRPKGNETYGFFPLWNPPSSLAALSSPAGC